MHAYKHALRKSEYLEGLQDDQERVSTFIRGLPFTLTGAQERSLQEILFDMRSGHRMNRLLQGDVGSGKTQSQPSQCMLLLLLGSKPH